MSPRGHRSKVARLWIALAGALLLMLPAIASAHAILIASTPTLGAATPTSPPEIRLQFSEAITLLNPANDCQVVNHLGGSVESGPCHINPTNVRELDAPLIPGLAPGTYTVRYRVVSADSHVVGAAVAFAIGNGPVGLPYLGNRPAQGPSETSLWETSARFFEILGICGLVSVLAFRWLIWGPAWGPRRRQSSYTMQERTAARGWGHDFFWTTFSAVALGAMLAEAYMLVVYTATVLGTSVAGAAGDTSGIGSVLSGTRFGSLMQFRGALLFVIFAIGAWQFLSESADTAPAPTGRVIPGVLMGVLSIGVLFGLSSQGHASQAPLTLLQEGADVIHLGAAAIWIGGLAWTVVTVWRLPHAAPAAGPAIATDVLAQFSRIALISVGALIATGVIRTLGELSSPAQLWSTTYGVLILIKVGLLAIAGIIALRNRRITHALERHTTPHQAALRTVRNAALVEITVAIAIVVVAALLVAEIPGRVG